MATASVNHPQKENLFGKYRKSFENPVALLLTAKKGLKASAVFDFISFSKLANEHVEHLLNKTIKTFTSYKTNNVVLDATTSEKLLKLFALYDKGLTVFATSEEFNEWLSTQSFGLGGQVPETLLDTITGINMVNEELVNIEYGDLA